MRPARMNPLTSEGAKEVLKNHARILAGNISYGSGVNTDQSQNINGSYVTGTSPVTANATFSVAHSLGRVPIGFHTVRINAGGTIYDSGVVWTATTISLKCSVVSATFTLFLF